MLKTRHSHRNHSRPQKGFHDNAAAGIIVLMIVLLAMNATAVLLRNKLQKKLN